ncbi:MAG TPA: hypothetical protein P5260_13550 [Candidatus Competibacter sp.]|jgi:hypothetical protein|nr:hypothetical protein [Candidatus Competibacter sp.]MCC9004541.1 hypothetical protein [Candidatus Competibacter sp.]HRX62217.1 hypothetical protein [Candidatus Competibacter sp.]HUM90474.1 hypothetical protein [Candidatus Competibacter sp.]
MHILESSEDTVIGKIARASSAKRAAALMNYGNIISILLPFPLLIFWFGASMLVYAMNRHHPNPKVGHYTQQAAYRFYGITGFFIVIGTFIPGNGWIWHLVCWIVALLIMIPWSIIDLRRIRRDQWVDIPLDEQGHPLPGTVIA